MKLTEVMEEKTVTILKDDNGEYRVPGPDGTEAQAYYTDDKQDAEGTAAMAWKQAGYTGPLLVKFRKIRGYHNG